MTKAQVHTIVIDVFNISELLPHLHSFDAVVIGPGPGSPCNDTDVGVIKDLWALDDSNLLPIFGVCLGFQSLCLHYGATVNKLPVVKHGQNSVIQHKNNDIFKGANVVNAVRYHSLYVTGLGDGGGTSSLKQDLEELAYAQDEAQNGRIPMAVRHKWKPFWAVQYHPESICTEGGGDTVIANFWKSARQWSQSNNRTLAPLRKDWKVSPRPTSLFQNIHKRDRRETKLSTEAQLRVDTASFFAPYLSVSRICEMLGVATSSEFILLESAASPGRFSIISVLTTGKTNVIRYQRGQSTVSLVKVGDIGNEKVVDLEKLYHGSVWEYISDFMHHRKAVGGNVDLPFWGGLVGYLNYEVGVSALGISKIRQAAKWGRRSDISLAFVERSIIYDSQTQRVYLQSLLKDDQQWLNSTKVLLQQEAQMSLTPCATPPPNTQNCRRQPLNRTSSTIPGLSKSESKVTMPDMELYLQKVPRLPVQAIRWRVLRTLLDCTYQCLFTTGSVDSLAILYAIESEKSRTLCCLSITTRNNDSWLITRTVPFLV